MHLSFCKYLVQSNLWNVNPSAFLLANTPDREIEWNVSNKSFPTDFKQIRIGNETSLAAAAAATFDWSVGSSSPFELHNCGHDPWIHVSHAIILYSDCQTRWAYHLPIESESFNCLHIYSCWHSSSPIELHNCGHPWIHVSHAITECCTQIFKNVARTNWIRKF